MCTVAGGGGGVVADSLGSTGLSLSPALPFVCWGPLGELLLLRPLSSRLCNRDLGHEIRNGIYQVLIHSFLTKFIHPVYKYL